MSEYNNNSVNGSACSYANLTSYNNGRKGVHPPVPATTTSGVYIVPDYSPPGYDTLLHGGDAPSCSGYFNINSAYGGKTNPCSTRFVQRLC